MHDYANRTSILYRKNQGPWIEFYELIGRNTVLKMLLKTLIREGRWIPKAIKFIGI